MIVQDQREIIDFLCAPGTHGGGPIRRIDTHGAVVVLTATRAYKLKRAVRFPYLDYGTPERRRAMCEAEVRLNRRTAPRIYERIAAVTRESDGRLAIDGAGTAIDWLVVMRRFDDSLLFDRLAEEGRLDEKLIEALCAEIDRFQRSAEIRSCVDLPAEMMRVVEIAARELQDQSDVFPASDVAAAVAGLRQELERRTPVLAKRPDGGFVRLLHGDLHLRNICLIDGKPVLFDSIEFDERLAVCDALYDLAFLLMDLGHRGRRDLANVVLNEYAWRTSDDAGLALLPLYLACRAAIRAHVGGPAAKVQPDAAARDAKVAEANRYLREVTNLLDGSPPRLIAIGGLSGSGKSTMSRALAPEVGGFPGAVILRSDVIRKKLFGRDPLERLPPEAYRPEVSAKVFDILFVRAANVLASGRSVIADAVWNRVGDRQRLTEVARVTGVPFVGFWLDAPAEVLRARVAARSDDASDADLAVLESQLASASDAVEWRRIDAGGKRGSALGEMRRIVRSG
ncbi:MAG: hypothetical protein FJX65_05740 [Alphaproteobacteria bacterium]|nr:hypothetical protein [Alphaproteobacteria bacterium]